MGSDASVTARVNLCAAALAAAPSLACGGGSPSSPPPVDASADGVPGEAAAPAAERLDEALRAAMAGASIKDAASEVAARYGLKRRDVYARALELRREAVA